MSKHPPTCPECGSEGMPDRDCMDYACSSQINEPGIFGTYEGFYQSGACMRIVKLQAQIAQLKRALAVGADNECH